MKQNTAIKIICALLVFLFVYAAVSKLANFAGFRVDMYNQPLPAFAKPILIWAVPIIELIIAALLIFDATRLAGLYASFALTVAFTFYTAVVLLHFFKYIPCSCGGIIKNLSWSQHLVFNLFFVLMALIGIFRYPLKTKNYKTE
jgi:putative oxidoreductase